MKVSLRNLTDKRQPVPAPFSCQLPPNGARTFNITDADLVVTKDKSTRIGAIVAAGNVAVIVLGSGNVVVPPTVTPQEGPAPVLVVDGPVTLQVDEALAEILPIADPDFQPAGGLAQIQPFPLPEGPSPAFEDEPAEDPPQVAFDDGEEPESDEEPLAGVTFEPTDEPAEDEPADPVAQDPEDEDPWIDEPATPEEEKAFSDSIAEVEAQGARTDSAKKKKKKKK